MADIKSYEDEQKLNFPAEWDQDGQLTTLLRNLDRGGGFINGLCANIPIMCRGNDCPFLTTCRLHISGIDVEALLGKRCPVEIYEIIERFTWYIDSLNVNQDNIVDIGLVKELVDIDVMLERADRRAAEEGDFLEDVTIAVDEYGNEIKQKQISKTVDFREKQQKRKEQILSLLNSTRKDKAGAKITLIEDASTHAARLLERKRELEAQGKTITVKPVEEKDDETQE